MSYRAGEICWVDLLAKDRAEASAFYGQVFGWTTTDTETPGHPYSMFRRGDDLVAGVGEMNDGMKAAGVPVVWNSYVAVEDIEKAVVRAAELGGTVTVPPQKGGESGWLAYLCDPEGAAVALWQAADGGEPAIRGPVGTSNWNELNTRDLAGAEAFYGGLFGWSFDTSETAPGFRYTTMSVRKQPVAGAITMDETWGDAPPHWMVYFASDDVDATVATAVKAGGTACVPPTDFPAGRFAMLNDPDGGFFSVIKMNH